VWFGFSETMVGNFAAQIVDGLDYLHSQVLTLLDLLVQKYKY
jgi:hypothetical protein